MPLLGVVVDVHVGLVSSEGCMQRSIEWRQQSFAPRDAKTGVLAFSDEGFKLFDFQFVVAQELSDGFSQVCDLALRQLHGASNTIKNPSEDLFAGVPDALAFEDQFLVRDRVFSGVSCGCGWGENLVDGMEQGPAVVAHCVWVGGLQEGTEIIKIDFE